MESDVGEKLAAARTRLILDKPFLGALVLRLPMVAADPKWCRSAYSDTRQLFFNVDYMRQLDFQQVQFVLAKQALHCAFSHFARRQHRVAQQWNLACDYAVNPLLISEGLQAPDGTVTNAEFYGLTAEEIYPLLDSEHEASELRGSQSEQEDDTSASLDAHTETDGESGAESGSGGGMDDVAGATLAPEPDRMSTQDQDEQSLLWQQRLASAAQTAMQSGKLSSEMLRMVDLMRQSKVPWRALLARYVTSSARDDYSYIRPTSRRGDPAIFPSLRSGQVSIVVGVDVSGSIADTEMQEFLSEVDAIKSGIRARVILLPCDDKLSDGAPWIFEPWEDIELPRSVSGGGGTRFPPVFDWVDAQDVAPNLVVYFTDAKGEFPGIEPDYPVVWLVKGKQTVPWGQRVQLN
ncbi:MAG: VWA-like domain-containing protein [Pseudomonadota bacterium]